MARYGVNVPRAPEIDPVENGATAEAEPTPSRPRRPKSAYLITLYAFAVAITPEFTFLGIPKVRFTDLLLPFMLFSFSSTLTAQVSRRQKSYFFSICFWLLLWDAGALFLWGEAQLTPGVFYLAKRAIYCLVALCCSACVQSVPAWNQVVRMLVFATPILNYSVLRELFTNQASGGILNTQEGMRASGIIAMQQTSTALFIVIVCCVSLGAWDSFKDITWRIGTTLALVTGVTAIFATGSRGGLACAGLSVVIILAQRPGKIITFGLVAGLVGTVAWSLTPAALQERLANIVPETTATISSFTQDRSLMPDAGSSSIAGRVVTAQWFFEALMPKAGLMGLGAGWRNLGAIDDFYLTEWLYHGLIGLVLFMRLQVSMVNYCFKATKESKDPVEKGVATGVAAAVIVMSASGVHADTFYLIRPMECLALLVGMVAARRALRE